MIPNVDSHDGGLMVFVDHKRKSIIQHVFLKRDINVIRIDQAGLAMSGDPKKKIKQE
jgi:hypothetical protein